MNDFQMYEEGRKEELTKQALTLGSVVVSEAELCGCGSELKVINDEDYCPNVDCFKHG